MMKIEIELTQEQVQKIVHEVTNAAFNKESDVKVEPDEEPEREPDEEPKKKSNGSTGNTTTNSVDGRGRSKKIADETIKQIKDRVDNGEKLPEICREMDLNYQSVYDRVNNRYEKKKMKK